MRTQLRDLSETEPAIDFNPPVVEGRSTAEAQRTLRSRGEKKREEMTDKVSIRKITSLFLFLLFFSPRDLSVLCASAVEGPSKTSTSAQEPQKHSPEKPAESAQDDQSESTIVCRTLLAIINVSVTDNNNQPITGLRLEDFVIAEDGVKQVIASFAHRDSPVNFSLLFNISDYDRLKVMAQDTVQSFVRQIRSTDEVTIPQLRAGRDAVRRLTADNRKVESALSKNSFNDKAPLFDVIAEGIKYAREEHQEQRKVTVVITDGYSLSDTASDRDAAYAILRDGAPVYFIILDDGRNNSRLGSQSRVRQTRALLTRLAEVSGGQALVVKREDEISAATEQIINRLKNQYRVGYYLLNDEFDGAFRFVRVTVTPKDKRKVKVFAPLGYYAVDPFKTREEKSIAR